MLLLVADFSYGEIMGVKVMREKMRKLFSIIMVIAVVINFIPVTQLLPNTVVKAAALSDESIGELEEGREEQIEVPSLNSDLPTDNTEDPSLTDESTEKLEEGKEEQIEVPSLYSHLPTDNAENGMWYRQEGAGVKITEFTNPGSEVVIPNTLGGRPVTTIAQYALDGKNVNKITIPATVTRIEGEAFIDCSNLKDIYFSGNAPSMGQNAFSNLHANLMIHFRNNASGFTAGTWIPSGTTNRYQAVMDELTISVVDSNRNIVPNAEICLRRNNKIEYAITDANGLCFLECGDYEVVYSTDNRRLYSSNNKMLINSAQTTAQIILYPSEVSGRITNQKGVPLAKMRVTAKGQSTTTDANGYYKFQDLDPNETVVVIAQGEYQLKNNHKIWIYPPSYQVVQFNFSQNRWIGTVNFQLTKNESTYTSAQFTTYGMTVPNYSSIRTFQLVSDQQYSEDIDFYLDIPYGLTASLVTLKNGQQQATISGNRVTYQFRHPGQIADLQGLTFKASSYSYQSQYVVKAYLKRKGDITYNNIGNIVINLLNYQFLDLNGPATVANANTNIILSGKYSIGTQGVSIYEVNSGGKYTKLTSATLLGSQYTATIRLNTGIHTIIAIDDTSGIKSDPLTIQVGQQQNNTRPLITKVTVEEYYKSGGLYRTLPYSSVYGMPTASLWANSSTILNGIRYYIGDRNLKVSVNIQNIGNYIPSIQFTGEEYTTYTQNNDLYTFSINNWKSAGLAHVNHDNHIVLVLKHKKTGQEIQQRIAHITIMYDPSGYVYEETTGERIAEATATLEKWNEATGQWQQWEDPDKEQENPQLTTEEGRYGWMVEEGKYRVKVQKDGYVNVVDGGVAALANTPDGSFDASIPNDSTMTVLPPRFDVNIPLHATDALPIDPSDPAQVPVYQLTKIPSKIEKGTFIKVLPTKAMLKLNPDSIEWIGGDYLEVAQTIESGGKIGAGGCIVKVVGQNPSPLKKGTKAALQATITYKTSKGIEKTKKYKKNTSIITKTTALSIEASDRIVDNTITFSKKKETVTANVVLNKGDTNNIPTNAKLKWFVADSAGKKVATVNSKGVIKAVGPGETDIIVVPRDNKVKGMRDTEIPLRAVIHVVNPKTQEVSFMENGAIVTEKELPAKGSTFDLTTLLSIIPENAFQKEGMKFKWESSNRKAISVNSKGIVKAVGKEGSAQIKVTAKEGVPKGETAPSATITIKIAENKQ